MALTTRCSSHLSTLPGIDRASENGFSLLFNNQHQLDDGEKKYYVHGCGIILSGLAELRSLIPAAEGGRGEPLFNYSGGPLRDLAGTVVILS